MARKRDWKQPIKLPTGGGAEAWAYLSKSGLTLKVYVRPLDEIGEPILPSPIRATVQLSRLRRNP